MRRTRELALVVVLAVAMACASIPAKQKATTALSGSEVTLAAAQDAERQLCDQAKAAVMPQVPITDCVGQVATAVGLTTERHRAVAAALAKAFELQSKTSVALQAWRSGDPAPAGLTEISQAASEALAVVKQLTAGNAKVADLITKIERILAQVADISAALKGGK